MSMGREGDRQDDLIVTWAEMPRSPGHVFYDRLQEVLIAGGFDGFVETACQPYYAPKMGAPSVPPGRYFRMHMVGYFEGICSERGIAWRCSDSMSLRDFLRLENREKVPDHSWLSKTRGRLPREIHETVFSWVLKLVAEQGLVKGKRIGIDASTMEANAALRTIVRRDDGRTYHEMLTQIARESGIETPSADDLVRIDRTRKGKKLSNEEAAEKNLAQIDAAPTQDEPSEVVADKGYHSRAVLKDLNGGAWKTRIAEPKQRGFSRWHGDDKARAAVYANRTRLGSAVGKQAMRRRAEIVERSFAHNLDRGGMRRTWLRGRDNVHKRYLVHVAGHNLGILMRLLIGAGTPRQAAARALAYTFFFYTEEAVTVVLLTVSYDRFAVMVLAVADDPA